MIKLTGGSSGIDRICFSSLGHSATAISQPDNKIKIEYDKTNSKSPFDILLNERTLKLISFLEVIIIFSHFLKSFFITSISNVTMLNIVYFTPTISWIILMVLLISTMHKSKLLLKNHAAEHMVIKAYNTLHRVPTINEAKKFSRFSPNCGISIYSAIITGQLIGYFLFSAFGYIVPEILLVIIPIFLFNQVPFCLLGLFGQLFTTAKPDNYNIFLAIIALKSLEKRVGIFGDTPNSIISVLRDNN